MSRIKIEDLPVAENLTPEQEALIEGAGLRPFRPTLEGLEDRQLMDAGFGHALLAPMLPTAGGGAGQDGHVRILGGQQQSVDAQAAGSADVRDVGALRALQNTPADAATRAGQAVTDQNSPANNVLGRVGDHAVSSQQPAGALAVSQAQDEQHVAKFIADQVSGKFNEILGTNRWNNAWWLQEVTGANGTYLASGTRIHVQVNFNYGVAWGIKGNAVLEFRKEGMVGGREGWTFDNVESIDWKGLEKQDVPGTKDFRERITQVYQGWRIGGQALYGEKELADQVGRAMGKTWYRTNIHGGYPWNWEQKAEGLFKVRRIEALDGGGLRIEFSNTEWGRGVIIELNCDGLDATSGSYALRVGHVDEGEWMKNGTWESFGQTAGDIIKFQQEFASRTFAAPVWSAPRATAAPPPGIAAEVPGANEGSRRSPVLDAVQQHKDNPTLSKAQAEMAATDALFASLKGNERP
jgi:hypothetical protein